MTIAGTLRKNRPFLFFWISQGVSVAGDSFSLVALPLLILHNTGSVVQMGLLTGLTSVGSIGTGVFAGVIVDRVDRRKLMIVCDIARSLLYGLIPLLWMISPQVWLLYLVVPLGAVFGMGFQITYVTAVPNLVDKEQITAANGRLEATYAVMTIAGMTGAGLLCAALGPVTAVAIDAASFAASALGLSLIRFRPPEGEHTPAPAGTVSRREFTAGARFLWQTPLLRALTGLLSLQTFITLGLTDIFIFYLKHDLGEGDSVVGYVLAAATIGSMLAGGLVAVVRRTLGFGVTWIGAFTLCGLTIAAIGFTKNVYGVAALAVGFLFFTGLAGICSMSLRQELTPDALLGRVTSAFWTIHQAVGPLGAALLTAAVNAYSVASVCLVSGIACALIALSGIFTAVGRAGAGRPLRPTSPIEGT
ncbi:MFS transporter [Streptomyces sp. NPDC001093]|uniref:MFS transporter n=1 Tax=Streptomyces sp. NPDC001093 TaxID=3154376 RepID=UPI00331B5DBC